MNLDYLNAVGILGETLMLVTGFYIVFNGETHLKTAFVIWVSIFLSFIVVIRLMSLAGFLTPSQVVGIAGIATVLPIFGFLYERYTNKKEQRKEE